MRFWRAVEVLAWAAFFAFAAVVLALRFWVLPDVERYRGDIVARVTLAVGLPVKIGSIEAGWLGLRPKISFFDVRIHDAEGREALVLPQVDNVVAWRSLFVRDLRLHSLRIDGPRLAVRRDAGGAFYVAGIKLAGGEGESRLADWILGQDEIQIRNAEIEWRDEKRGAPPLALAAVNLRLRNSGDLVAVGLTGRPPAALAESIELRATLSALGVTGPAAWRGRLYAVLGQTDLAAWRAWVDYPLDVRQGQGALRLWSTIEDGELRELTVDVALNQVVAALGSELAPLELSSLRGRLNGRASKDGYELTARELALVAAQGPALQPTDFRINWRPAGGTAAESGALTARLIEFEPLARLSGSLPVPAALRTLVGEFEPRGQLTDVRFEWHGAAAAPDRFSLRARIADAGMRSWREVPGFAGLSGSIEATETKGRLQLRAHNAVIRLARIFPEPDLAFETLTGQIDWELTGADGYVLRLSPVSFANRDLAGAATGTYASSGAGPGRIDLAASLSRADGGRIGRYLPHGEMMGPKTRGWLASSILAGQASDVQLRLRGELASFPFTDPASGQFLVTGRFRNGVLDYADGWPRIVGIEGELRFERDHMDIAARSGGILGARIANVRAVISGLGAQNNRLAVSGQAEGPSGEFLRYIEVSPVRRMTGGLTGAISASGRGKLRLKLDIPLDAPETTKVAGDYEFAANRVTLHRQLPPMERVSGRVSFTQSGFALHDVRGRLFGGAMVIGGGSRPGAGVEVTARGELTVAGLGALLEDPWRRHVSGASSYAATVSARDGVTRIGFETSLRGVASALPAPLDKLAGEALPLRVDVIPAEGGARDRVSVSLGRRAAAEFLRRRQGDAATAPMVVQRASVWLTPLAGQALRIPERPGTLIYGSLSLLDLDSWLPLVSGGGGAAAASFDLDIGALDVYGKRVHKAELKAATGATGWSATISAEELAGELSYSGERGGKLTARLAHFTSPADSPGAAARAADPKKELPAIDLVAERFTFRGKALGRVALEASRAGEDWRLEKLAMANPDSTLQASGLLAGGAFPRSAFDFEIEASDSGKFLERVGYPGLVRGGKARLQGSLAWQGEPAALDYPSLSGRLNLNAEDGQFLEIEPGLGKLVSLMNLQALPRRVTLDFRDVFSKGFSFDRIAASAQIDRGVMKVEEFRMRGSSAEVEMTGETDLTRETQNLKLRVVPSLGGSAATAVAIVNPIAGVAAAIAQWVLKNPLGQIFAYDYAVTGSWSDPKIEKLTPPRPPESERVSP